MGWAEFRGLDFFEFMKLELPLITAWRNTIACYRCVSFLWDGGTYWPAHLSLIPKRPLRAHRLELRQNRAVT